MKSSGVVTLAEKAVPGASWAAVLEADAPVGAEVHRLVGEFPDGKVVRGYATPLSVAVGDTARRLAESWIGGYGRQSW